MDFFTVNMDKADIWSLSPDLHQYDRREHDHAAHDFPAAHPLSKEQSARDHRKHRFQAHEERRDRRIRVLLRDDLQCISKTARDKAAVKDRNGGRHYFGQAWIMAAIEEITVQEANWIAEIRIGLPSFTK